MIKFVKKYWIFIILGFIATTLVIINIFLPKKTAEIPQQNTPTQQNETFKGIIPGQTTQEDLIKKIGAPDPKESDFSKNILSFPREGGGPENKAIIKDNKVQLFKQQALEGDLSTYIQKYNKPEDEFYGEYQESGFKTYVWATKGIAIVASINNGYIFEIWYFEPTTMDQFIANFGQNLTKEPKQLNKY